MLNLLTKYSIIRILINSSSSRYNFHHTPFSRVNLQNLTNLLSTHMTYPLSLSQLQRTLITNPPMSTFHNHCITHSFTAHFTPFPLQIQFTHTFQNILTLFFHQLEWFSFQRCRKMPLMFIFDRLLLIFS